MQVICDFGKRRAPFRHFWESTGFTPAKLLLDRDMEQLVTTIGALPHKGIKFVRIHHLLELVRIENAESDAPVYDWSELERGLDLLTSNGLKPIFELMGNPSGFFTDFCNDLQLHVWRRLVRDLALHLIDRYGRTEVGSWYFETWNEPDTGWWPQHPQETPFCNYYDACSEGLKAADPTLILGGPGTCRYLSSMLTTFLAHCDHGVNYFTGESGVRLDFISVHEKGAPPSREDITPDNQLLCEHEADIVGYIREHHPRLAATPFMNNECDPIVGWSQTHTWHARPYYAALVCKVMYQHQLKMIEELGCTYPVLSNDNGFLGGWGYRTLLARFGDDQGLARGEFEHVKKPVLTAMELLALLGDSLVECRGATGTWADLGVLPTTRDDGRIAILVQNHRDDLACSSCERVELRLENIPSGEARLVHYRIDAGHCNPYALWDRARGPKKPDAELLRLMRDEAEPKLETEPRDVVVENGTLHYTFDQPLPGVSLILLCRKTDSVPTRPRGLRALRYKGLTDRENVLVTWENQHAGDLRTWQVFFSETIEGPFGRLNGADILSSTYYHARRTATGRGYYKVAAVDYWDRRSEYSEVLEA